MSETNEEGQWSQSARSAEFISLVNKLTQASRKAGIDRNDIMDVLIQAFVRMLGFMDHLSRRSDRVALQASQRIEGAMAHARSTANAELQRFDIALKAAQAHTIADVSQAIAKSAEAALTKRVRIFQWRTVASTAAAIVIVVVASLRGGYEWGSWSTRSQLEQTKDELNAFSRLNPADSHRWAGLMLFNGNIKPDFDRCAETGGYDKGGRKACNFSFWIQ